MSDAVSTTGILVRRSAWPLAEPPVWTTVAELVSVTPPGFSRNEIETSTHNDGTESKVLGILRQRNASFRINWLPTTTTHAQLLTDILANARAGWQVAFPSGATFTGPGRIRQLMPADAPVDAAQQADAEISWAGPVTFDDGTP
jgi:hypothetical protein